tara:strand:+ start:44 stop:340 length:297 start_codon:yes stop_codon:yes gene_type:complete
MEFLCSKCSACCRNVGDLDLPSDDNGVCLNLDQENNTCKIYNTRPDICRVDKTFEDSFKDTMTKKEFYVWNTKACHWLIDKEGLDESFKVDIKNYDNV